MQQIPPAGEQPASSVAAAPGVLEHTLATTFAVGVNLKGRAAGAAWTYLLPTLDLRRVVCLGLPSAATLQTLGGLAARVDVVCATARRRRAQQRVESVGLDAVRVVAADGALGAGGVDLAVVSDAPPNARVVEAVLGNARHVFAERRGDGGGALWAAPAAGEVHRAATAHDATTIAFLRRVGGGEGRHGALKRTARRALGREPRGERTAQLTGAGAGVPQYVREIAAGAGVDLGDCRAGLWAPSQYASRKAILFLFPGDEPDPRWVVKLTREPQFNARLQNEWVALERLAAAGIGDVATLPQPVFSGEAGGLAVVGESAVSGAPLRSRTNAKADCPLAVATLRWLIEMGERSVTREVAPAASADALADLADRFRAIYELSTAQSATLDELIGRVRLSSALPLVFQHGDPGAWNVMVTDDARPIVLDWEAFEARGMPLWDAFYFARSHAVTVGRAGGTEDALTALQQGWLADGPAMRELAPVITAHRERLGIAPELVEALFATCWMHRALKEAGRLTPARLPAGHFARLLRLVLDQRDAPGLARLYGRA